MGEDSSGGTRHSSPDGGDDDSFGVAGGDAESLGVRGVTNGVSIRPKMKSNGWGAERLRPLNLKDLLNSASWASLLKSALSESDADEVPTGLCWFSGMEVS